MGKDKTGLRREISAIFDGVPIPKKKGDRSESKNQKSARDSIDPDVLKPTAPYPQTPQVLQPQQPVQPQPKVTRNKPLRRDSALQDTGQIPYEGFWIRVKEKLFAPKPGVSPTKQKIMAIMVIILLIALFFLLVRPFSSPSQYIAKPRRTGPTNLQVTAKSNIEIDWPIPNVYPTDIRDPMELGSLSPSDTIIIETTPTGTKRPKLIVRGIVYSEISPYAIIGTQIMREGEAILGVTIIKINRDSVVFEMDGETWTQGVESQEEY